MTGDHGGVGNITFVMALYTTVEGLSACDEILDRKIKPAPASWRPFESIGNGTTADREVMELGDNSGAAPAFT